MWDSCIFYILSLIFVVFRIEHTIITFVQVSTTKSSFCEAFSSPTKPEEINDNIFLFFYIFLSLFWLFFYCFYVYGNYGSFFLCVILFHQNNKQIVLFYNGKYISIIIFSNRHDQKLLSAWWSTAMGRLWRLMTGSH